MISEPGVALSDWGLAAECAILSRLATRAGSPGRGGAWLALFFGSAGVAALLGGAVHGLFPVSEGLAQQILWALTVLALGVTAWAAWTLGAHLAFGPAVGRMVAVVAGLELAAYAIVASRSRFHFAVAVANYLPAALFLLGVFVGLAVRRPDRRLALGIAGLGLTFVAAAVQRLGSGPLAGSVNRNTAYHVIQALALALIYRGATGALAPRGAR